MRSALLALPAPRTHVRLQAVESKDPEFGSIRHPRPSIPLPPRPMRRICVAYMFSTKARSCHGNVTISSQGAVNDDFLETIREIVRDNYRLSRRKHVTIVSWQFLESEVTA